jgi:hypothetical protein
LLAAAVILQTFPAAGERLSGALLLLRRRFLMIGPRISLTAAFTLMILGGLLGFLLGRISISHIDRDEITESSDSSARSPDLKQRSNLHSESATKRIRDLHSIFPPDLDLRRSHEHGLAPGQVPAFVPDTEPIWYDGVYFPLDYKPSIYSYPEEIQLDRRK